MKKQSSKYRWMAALMISSQLLLTGFVIYWLISQFQDEQRQLHATLKQEYLATHEQMIDSMLLKNLITPTLNDSMTISLFSSHDFDKVSDRQVFALHLGEGNTYDSIRIDSTLHSGGPEEEMLVRSVRLFIEQTDETFRANPSAHILSMHVDSATFQLQLDERFRSLGWNFLLEPLDGGLSKSQIKVLDGMVLANFSDSSPPFLVKRYSWHILKLMFPQFLFALILLGLSASALLFSYRSLSKQLALNTLRDDFIGNISHELKTPVSTVKVALEALGKYDLKKDPQRSVEYLEMATRELGRLEGLVDKVLHHQMLENPSVLLQKEDCNLLVMVRRVIQTLDIRMKEKKAEVSVHETAGPCNVMVDPVYMEGVITNLLDNSLKYAGPNPQIHIQISCDGSGTSLSVQDNGPGIPDEFKNQVFDKFFRIPVGDRHDVKGYGLGLNFASQVMAHHGGSISIKNLSPVGCIFTLHFTGGKT